MIKKAVVINTKDNVATAVDNLTAGNQVSYFVGKEVEHLVVSQDIPLGHKLAIRDIPANEQVIKYGESIGTSLVAIKKGEHVHVHNMQSNRGRGDWKTT